MYGMDSSTLSLLGFGIVVISGAVIMYLVSLFTMKETSFESVLEEQRKKKDQEDKERSLQNKRKREMYKKRFDLKKKKTTTVGNGKVDSGVSPMHEVQIKESPQMESGEPDATASEPKKQPKGRATKKQQEAVAQKTDDIPKHPILKQAPEKPKEQTTKIEVQQKKQDSGRTRNMSFSDDGQEKQKPEDSEKSKKKKKREPEVENEIVGRLREASLSDRDVQNILTWIRQKHAIDVGGGSKIKDLQHQLDSTKKQLNQSETNLQQYVNRCMAAENKIEHLKQDLMLEKTKATSLEKALQDSEAKRVQELASVQSRHMADMKQIQDKIAMAADYEEKCRIVEQMNMEKKSLIAEIQKNANVIGEKSRLASDLQQVRNQLQESHRRCAELESQLKQRNSQSETMQHAQGEKEKVLLIQLNDRANALQQMQQNYSTLDTDFQKIKSELQATQSDSTKLLEQVTSLTEDNDAKTDAQRDLEQRLAESEQAIVARDSQLQDSTQQNSELSAQVQKLEQQIAQLNSQLVEIDQEGKSKAAADTQSAEEAEHSKKLQEELETVRKEKDSMKVEVDRLKKKNNDLRDRSWKAMDTISDLEKSIPKKVNAAQVESNVRCSNLESSVRQSLMSAFPNVSVSEEKFESWVEAFTLRASESAEPVQSASPSPELVEARVELQQLHVKFEETSTESARLQSKISALESSVSKLAEEKDSLKKNSEEELTNAIEECKKYQRVLNDTEAVLGKLQSSVEVEERSWRRKVEDAQREASRANQDAENLRKTISDLKSEKMALAASSQESDVLKERLEEAASKICQLKEQLDAAKVAVNGNLQQSTELENCGENVAPTSADEQPWHETTAADTVSCQPDSPINGREVQVLIEAEAVGGDESSVDVLIDVEQAVQHSDKEGVTPNSTDEKINADENNEQTHRN